MGNRDRSFYGIIAVRTFERYLFSGSCYVLRFPDDRYCRTCLADADGIVLITLCFHILQDTVMYPGFRGICSCSSPDRNNVIRTHTCTVLYGSCHLHEV